MAPIPCVNLCFSDIVTYQSPAYRILHLNSALYTTLSILLRFHETIVGPFCSTRCSLCASKPLGQNSSSAFRQRDCLSRVRRASTSAADSSPWTLLSLVRTLTLLVIFSFSPTTAKEHTTALVIQFTQQAATLTHSHTAHIVLLSSCVTMFCLTENDNGMKIKSNVIVLGE